MGLREVISTPHQRVHEGKFFSCGHKYSAVSDTGVVEFLIQVGSNKSLHAVFSASGEGNFDFQLFEGSTFSAAGTTVTPFDHNRITANTTDATVTHTPTITGDGTSMGAAIFVPGGSKGGGGSPVGASGASAFDGEIILATSTDYLIRLTNNAGAASDMHVGVSYYEVG